MRNIYLGLGSNIGNKKAHLERALERITKFLTVLRVSSLYETAPVGNLDQDWFLNAVIEVDAEQNPRELMDVLLGLESDMGRHRGVLGGPRTIDIDILFFHSKIIEREDLQIPHPRLWERRFVLEPLMELCPKFVHPVLKITVTDMTRQLGTRQEIRRL